MWRWCGSVCPPVSTSKFIEKLYSFIWYCLGYLVFRADLIGIPIKTFLCWFSSELPPPHFWFHKYRIISIAFLFYFSPFHYRFCRVLPTILVHKQKFSSHHYQTVSIHKGNYSQHFLFSILLSSLSPSLSFFWSLGISFSKVESYTITRETLAKKSCLNLFAYILLVGWFERNQLNIMKYAPSSLIH